GLAYELKPEGRLFDSSWRQLGDPFEVPTSEDFEQFEPAVAAAGDGFVAAWTSGPEFTNYFPPLLPSQDRSLSGIFRPGFAPSRRRSALPAPRCSASAPTAVSSSPPTGGRRTARAASDARCR